MKISNITLHNFRIYKGLNNVSFLPFNNQNVSLVAGKNGFGKTTFLTSLIWVFYGKLMTQVESKYRKDIKNSGGYLPFLDSLLNRDIKSDNNKENSFFVEIELRDLTIPALPCNSIKIRRSYSVENKEEKLNILIDGAENELTKDVGYELFINDFILPREIAKFFFFDAEKIVSLAEAKSKEELRSLSKAYSEVLGIKKYEELKKNLESLLSKLRRDGVNKHQKKQLQKLINQENDSAKLLEYNLEQQVEIKAEISNYSLKSDQLQEKLIREGNAITLEELLELKLERDELKKETKSIKNSLSSLLELAPFVIAGKKLTQLKEQLDKESNEISALGTTLKNEIEKFSKELIVKFTKAKIGSNSEVEKIVKELIEEKFGKVNSTKNIEILNSFSLEQYRNFNAIYSSIKGAYVGQLNSIVQQEKNNRVLLSRVVNKIKQAEARKDNHLAKKLREEKVYIDSKVERFELKLKELFIEQGNLESKNNSDKKVLSEYEKSFNLQETDEKKYKATEILLSKINTLINKIKENKKFTLQKALKISLDKLMHKNGFISNVNVVIDGDIMDIELLDKNNKIINKDSLSKGEQQLYATALLKALVDESGIKFPIFIDSPLQKFDKYHSRNIIEQFYPSISDQVVLFPLLEKELTLKEYELLKPNIDKTFIIENNSKEGCSTIVKADIMTYFSNSKSETYV